MLVNIDGLHVIVSTHLMACKWPKLHPNSQNSKCTVRVHFCFYKNSDGMTWFNQYWCWTSFSYFHTQHLLAHL